MNEATTAALEEHASELRERIECRERDLKEHTDNAKMVRGFLKAYRSQLADIEADLEDADNGIT